MAEAGLLVAFAPAARALAPQVTAVPPLAVFHDLRWLYSAQRSWLEFALLLAGLILARSAVNSVLVRLAWPAAGRRPRRCRLCGCALGFTVFACLLISPVASLALGVAILPSLALPRHAAGHAADRAADQPRRNGGRLVAEAALAGGRRMAARRLRALLSVAAAVTGQLPIARRCPGRRAGLPGQRPGLVRADRRGRPRAAAAAAAGCWPGCSASHRCRWPWSPRSRW